MLQVKGVLFFCFLTLFLTGCSQKKTAVEREQNTQAKTGQLERTGNKTTITKSFKKVTNDLNEESDGLQSSKSDNPLIFSNTLVEQEVVKEEKIEEIGTTMLELSNGAKVYLKPTTLKKGDVQLRAFSFGGTCMLSDKDFLAGYFSIEVQKHSGLGALSSSQLERMLAGKQLELIPIIGAHSEQLSGFSTTDHLEVLLQLLYLTFTEPGKDKLVFDQFQHSWVNNRRQLENQPLFGFLNEFNFSLYEKSVRTQPLLATHLEEVQFDQTHRIFKDRFQDASDFAFVIAGDFEVENVKTLVKQYIGNIPSIYRKEKGKGTVLKFAKGGAFESGSGGGYRGSILMNFSHEESWSMEKHIALTALQKILQAKLLRSLQKEKGILYWINLRREYSLKNKSTFEIFAEGNRNDTNCIIEQIKQEVVEIQQNGVTEVDLSNVRQTLHEELVSSKQGNEYWAEQIKDSISREQSLRDIPLLERIVLDLNSNQVRQVARDYLKNENLLVGVLK